MLNELHATHKDKATEVLKQLQETAIQNKNIFAELMEAVKYCSLGQITFSLFEVFVREEMFSVSSLGLKRISLKVKRLNNISPNIKTIRIIISIILFFIK